MKKLIFLSFTIIFLSCKTESKNTKEKDSVVNSENQEREFIINISYRTNKADEIKIMMNDIIIDEFQKSNIHIIESVIPTNTFDNITAKFGRNNISKNLFINLGIKEEKEIEFEYINISYGQNQVSINNQNFKQNFVFNSFIVFDSINGKIKTIQTNGRHNPTMILNRRTLNRLNEEKTK